MGTIILLPIVWSLGGVLVLLLIWRRHRQRIDTGIISPVNLLNPSGIQWHLFAVRDHPDVCASCRAAHGSVFLTRAVTRPGFAASGTPCTTPEICGGLLLPFSGGWLEANEIMNGLTASKAKSRTLSLEELRRLAAAEWQPGVAQPDRAGLHLLSAFLTERPLPNEAMRSYGAVLTKAALPRDQAVLMASYLRLAGLLAQRGNPREALRIIEHFEKRVRRADPGTFSPTGKQRRALSTMKPYLYSLIDAESLVWKPATIDRADPGLAEAPGPTQALSTQEDPTNEPASDSPLVGDWHRSNDPQSKDQIAE